VNLFVRLLKRLHRDLTKPRCFSGRRQPAQVSSARARSADQSQGALCAALEADGSLISPCVTCFQVHNNLLTSLPAEVGQLRQLERLSVRNSNWLDRDLTSSLRFRSTAISSNGCRPSWACETWILLISFLTRPPSFSFSFT
jgi:hypothetical protein